MLIGRLAVASAVAFAVLVGSIFAQSAGDPGQDPITTEAQRIAPLSTFIDRCGEWKLFVVTHADTVDNVVTLNGDVSFVITVDLQAGPDGGTISLDLGNASASCLLAMNQQDQQDCSVFEELLTGPYLCNGTLSIADLITAWQDSLEPPQPVSLTDQAKVVDVPNCECFVSGSWGVCSCMCEDNTVEECYACCRDNNPDPYPGGSGPWEKFRNCINDCHVDSCACNCYEGWLCREREGLCTLWCIPSFPWSVPSTR